MPRMIDVERFCADNPNFNSEVYVALSKAPTIDAVPVVRCKDCKHYENHKRKIYENCVREDRLVPMKPNGFCSYGERRCGNE